MSKLCLCLAIAAGAAMGQAFEVVSVKPSKELSNGSHSSSNQGRFTGENLPLRAMILMAYGINDYQLEGPEWLRSARFDVAAKFPEELPKDREKYNAGLHAMMRQMLVERFQLTVHREQKTLPVFTLVVGKNGIKFQQVADTGSHSQNNNNGHYKGECVSMESLASFLSRQAGEPVLDRTGLTGFFNLTLEWTPETRQAGDGKPEPLSDALAPPLAAALQEQLGLRLEARKAPVEIVVVDHAGRTPTEN